MADRSQWGAENHKKGNDEEEEDIDDNDDDDSDFVIVDANQRIRRILNDLDALDNIACLDSIDHLLTELSERGSSDAPIDFEAMIACAQQLSKKKNSIDYESKLQKFIGSSSEKEKTSHDRKNSASRAFLSIVLNGLKRIIHIKRTSQSASTPSSSGRSLSKRKHPNIAKQSPPQSPLEAAQVEQPTHNAAASGLGSKKIKRVAVKESEDVIQTSSTSPGLSPPGNLYLSLHPVISDSQKMAWPHVHEHLSSFEVEDDDDKDEYFDAEIDENEGIEQTLTSPLNDELRAAKIQSVSSSSSFSSSSSSSFSSSSPSSAAAAATAAASASADPAAAFAAAAAAAPAAAAATHVSPVPVSVTAKAEIPFAVPRRVGRPPKGSRPIEKLPAVYPGKVHVNRKFAALFPRDHNYIREDELPVPERRPAMQHRQEEGLLRGFAGSAAAAGQSTRKQNYMLDHARWMNSSEQVNIFTPTSAASHNERSQWSVLRDQNAADLINHASASSSAAAAENNHMDSAAASAAAALKRNQAIHEILKSNATHHKTLYKLVNDTHITWVKFAAATNVNKYMANEFQKLQKKYKDLLRKLMQTHDLLKDTSTYGLVPVRTMSPKALKLMTDRFASLIVHIKTTVNQCISNATPENVHNILLQLASLLPTYEAAAEMVQAEYLENAKKPLLDRDPQK
jgi:hypothetical protein